MDKKIYTYNSIKKAQGENEWQMMVAQIHFPLKFNIIG